MIVGDGMVIALDCYVGGLPFESGILPQLNHACGERWLRWQEVSRCYTRGEFQGMYIMYASAKCKYGCPLWLWTPKEMSPEVQNRDMSGPIKDMCPPKFKKQKTKKKLMETECQFWHCMHSLEHPFGRLQGERY